MTQHTPTLYTFENVDGTFFIADGDEPDTNTGANPKVYADKIPSKELANQMAAAPLLLEALEAARRVFRVYEMLHNQKIPPETNKAVRNSQYAEMCETAIAAAKGE